MSVSSRLKALADNTAYSNLNCAELLVWLFNNRHTVLKQQQAI